MLTSKEVESYILASDQPDVWVQTLNDSSECKNTDKHKTDPFDHEGSILFAAFNEMQRRLRVGATVRVLNTSAISFEPIHIDLPPNLSHVWRNGAA
jgi:hypothetical protein